MGRSGVWGAPSGTSRLLGSGHRKALGPAGHREAATARAPIGDQVVVAAGAVVRAGLEARVVLAKEAGG